VATLLEPFILKTSSSLLYSKALFEGTELIVLQVLLPVHWINSSSSIATIPINFSDVQAVPVQEIIDLSSLLSIK